MWALTASAWLIFSERHQAARGQGQLQGFVEVLAERLDEGGPSVPTRLTRLETRADREGFQDDPVQDLRDLLRLGAGGVEPGVDLVAREDERVRSWTSPVAVGGDDHRGPQPPRRIRFVFARVAP